MLDIDLGFWIAGVLGGLLVRVVSHGLCGNQCRLCGTHGSACYLTGWFLLKVDFQRVSEWKLTMRGRRPGAGGKRDHDLTNISTGTTRSPGPEEGARKVEGRRERILEGRDWAAEPAPHELSSAKACCSEARRPASAGPPLAYPNPCSSSPFAPAGVSHGKTPPHLTHWSPRLQTAPQSLWGRGPESRVAAVCGGGGADTSGAALLRGLLRRAAQTAPSPSPPGPLNPNPPASPTTSAASRPCLCCSWWL